MIKLAIELYDKIEKGINETEFTDLIYYYNDFRRGVYMIEQIVSDAVDNDDTVLNDELKREIEQNVSSFSDITYRSKKLLEGLQSGDISLLDYEDLDGEIDAVGFIEDVKAEIESITEDYEFELSEYNDLIKRLKRLRAKKEKTTN